MLARPPFLADLPFASLTRTPLFADYPFTLPHLLPMSINLSAILPTYRSVLSHPPAHLAILPLYFAVHPLCVVNISPFVCRVSPFNPASPFFSSRLCHYLVYLSALPVEIFCCVTDPSCLLACLSCRFNNFADLCDKFLDQIIAFAPSLATFFLLHIVLPILLVVSPACVAVLVGLFAWVASWAADSSPLSVEIPCCFMNISCPLAKLIECPVAPAPLLAVLPPCPVAFADLCDKFFD